MVDTQEALESQYLTVDLVRSSKVKRAVVVDPGTYEEDMQKNKRLTVGINIDGKIKKWRPNKATVENMQALGSDSSDWIGKVVQFRIERNQFGREMVIGAPLDEEKPVEVERITKNEATATH